MKKLADRFFKNRVIPACAKLNGEYEYVVVEADYQPEERDTNTQEGAEIFAVWHEDAGNIIDSIEPADMRELESEILAEFAEYCADWFDGLGEYQRDMRNG